MFMRFTGTCRVREMHVALTWAIDGRSPTYDKPRKPDRCAPDTLFLC
jgi:hypothetical protein